MCGRIIRKTPRHIVAEHYGIKDDGPETNRRFNIPPSTQILAVRSPASDSRELVQFRWGLIPSWAKDAAIAFKTINARAKTVTEKPVYRQAFKARRCLIPADGFYEWKKAGKVKEPF
jgi:putative SOS response-associated peptidase YedK